MSATEKDFMTFVERVSKLEMMEFLGVARMLSVDLVTKDPEDETKTLGREFDAILSDMMDAYIDLNRTQRRNLDHIIERAVKKNKKNKSK